MMKSDLQPGQKVRFKLKDVHLPSIQDVLNRMTPDTELKGCITLLSDQGTSKSAYAVVEVRGILMPIIVPTGNAQTTFPMDTIATRN
ncbi:MAG: hypothetical protein FWD53_03770 [Phycisphaerales bacterium]|nr:hypothetical protein [Phycisphaerales bacterium]